jgi:hypothetical protein
MSNTLSESNLPNGVASKRTWRTPTAQVIEVPGITEFGHARNHPNASDFATNCSS